ncbi:hypothetical protein GCM10010177_70950 [Actinomadura citrea]|nr:hypothetical protein GCM10010177_70950 [Actinomadura citrea]
MSGSAALTIVLSSSTMNCPRQVTVSNAARFGTATGGADFIRPPKAVPYCVRTLDAGPRKRNCELR